MEPQEFNRYMDKLYGIVKAQSAGTAVDSLMQLLGHSNDIAGHHALCRLLVAEHARAEHAAAKYKDLQARLYQTTAEIKEEFLEKGRIF